jgi:hypothetical protein
LESPDEDDLDALVRRADNDRWLASRFVADPAARADLIALYAFDHELARAAAVTSNALLAEIRLTWWREMLEEAYEGRPVRRHPTAEALAGAITRRKLPRDVLDAMIDARIGALDGGPPASEHETVRAATLILDPATPEHFTAKVLSAAALPAVLPLLARRISNPLWKRLRMVWAVATGRL